jgi:hypothetical protein
MKAKDRLRVVAAMTAAVAAAALLAAVAARSARWFPFAFIVALLLALPAFIVLDSGRRRGRVTMLSSVVAGFLICALSFGYILLIHSPDFLSIDGTPTVVDGWKTAMGWFYVLFDAARFGLYGAVAGLVFWLWIGSSAAITGRTASRATAARLSVFSVAAVTIFAIVQWPPPLLFDRSCHNPFRGGLTSIGPEASLSLNVAEEEWPSVYSLLEEFALRRAWSSMTYVRTERRLWLIMTSSICNKAGTQIQTMGWLYPEEEVTLAVYQPQGGDSWMQPAGELVGMLSERWPGRLKFTGDAGEEVPVPEWIAPAVKK